ncbi:MAG: 16S rRNA (guanine(966)-N(2))-methyltransferase RsmD [Alphaproteobacteria bacterium]
MRIIGGKFKGRKLLPPEGDDIRPTSDRTRESVFNVLMHGSFGGTHVVGQHVADLCCGTGALGLEALSRGARAVTFVDKDKRAIALAKQNAMNLLALQDCFFLNEDVAALPKAREPVSLVLMDAPYSDALLAPAYESLRAGGWLQHGALIIAELPKKVEAPELPKAAKLDSRQYGRAAIHIYRCI